MQQIRQDVNIAPEQPRTLTSVQVRSETVRLRETTNLGWLPALSLVALLGVLLVAIAYAGSRAGEPWVEPVFWAGLLVLLVPIAARLATAQALRSERIGLVVMLVLGLYVVKILYSPFAFTFSDELTHTYNAKELLQHGHLFEPNAILPATPLYPGLQTVTAALAALSGLPVFEAGIVVIGAARLVLTLALYLFFEKVSHSPRVAGIAVLLYTTNSNFMFWGAQFAYQSLALPLATMVLFVVAQREDVQDGNQRLALNVTALLTLMTVVTTHHMTSYALIAFLWAVSALCWLVSALRRRRIKGNTYGPSGLALISLVLALTWLLNIASNTIPYLSPVIGGAISSTVNLIAGEETGRKLFESGSGSVAPVWERVVGLGSVLLLLCGVPFGLWQVWQRYRSHPMAYLLAGAALAYFAAIGMRFTAKGWETANRAQEFLFVGLAFIIALGIVRLWMHFQVGWVRYIVLAGYVGVIFVGGSVAGWAPKARLPRPYTVEVAGQVIEPQGITAATWMRAFLGPDNRIVVDQSNARLMLAYGEQYPLTGRRYGVQEMFYSTQIDRGEREILQTTRAHYAVVDRREISWDNMVGLYFNRGDAGSYYGTEIFDQAVYTKWDRQENVSKFFDSGNIAIYDVESLSNGSSAK